jgi:hypothetical protein
MHCNEALPELNKFYPVDDLQSFDYETIHCFRDFDFTLLKLKKPAIKSLVRLYECV